MKIPTISRGVSGMNEEPRMPKSIWSGTLRVFGVELRCHVLSDGQRVIEAESMADFLRALGDGATVNEEDLMALAKWYRGMSA